MNNKFIKARKFVTDYIIDYCNKFEDLADCDEYYELVISIIAFSYLIQKQFKELYEIDEIDGDIMLADLKAAASSIAEEVYNAYQTEKNKNLN